jgi:hypothetical protein
MVPRPLHGGPTERSKRFRRAVDHEIRLLLDLVTIAEHRGAAQSSDLRDLLRCARKVQRAVAKQKPDAYCAKRLRVISYLRRLLTQQLLARE